MTQQPKHYDVYYYIENGQVKSQYWTGNEEDLQRFNSGNCYASREEAQANV